MFFYLSYNILNLTDTVFDYDKANIQKFLRNIEIYLHRLSDTVDMRLKDKDLVLVRYLLLDKESLQELFDDTSKLQAYLDTLAPATATTTLAQ